MAGASRSARARSTACTRVLTWRMLSRSAVSVVFRGALRVCTGERRDRWGLSEFCTVFRVGCGEPTLEQKVGQPPQSQELTIMSSRIFPVAIVALRATFNCIETSH